MNYDELLSERVERGQEETPLSESEQVYLDFRTQVEPNLFDTGFDLLPAKSEPFGYTDQTLRSHILNGASFAVRLNHGLLQINPEAALDLDSLREVIALFAVHDLHKTSIAQQRREESTNRRDADKDLTAEEVSEYVTQLALDEYAPTLSETDFRAAALGTESQSGRHRSATSRTFVAYRPWLRLMDAAASLDDPADAATLHARLHEISEDVSLSHHTISDTKGITTNFLTSAITSYVESNTDALALVYFSDGAIYLSPSTGDLSSQLPERAVLNEELTDAFLDTIRENVGEASTLEETRQTLVDKLNYGFMEFSRPTYLLYGFDRANEALKQDLADRMSGEPTLYSQYELAATAAYGAGVVSKLPTDWRTGQAATVYISTLYKELFNPLEDEETLDAIETMAEALGVPAAATWLSELEDLTWDGELSDAMATELASHMPTTAADATENATELGLSYVNRFAGILAIAYIEDGADGSLTGVSTEGVLERLSERLLQAFRAWDDDWDGSLDRAIDDETAEEKAEAFLTEKISTVRKAIHQYITDTVTLFGQSLGAGPTTKSKLDEYTSQYQPHICLLCNAVLTGSTSKSDFETSQDTIGMSMRFSHLSEITAAGGEPDALACPMCELEMVIRNSIHDFRDEESKYLFVAPDYFYSPADITFEKTIREYLFASDGYNIFQVAQRLLSEKPDNRSAAVSELLDVLSPDDSPAYQNSIKNYDSVFDDYGSLGVFRLDPPLRDTGSDNYVTRIPREILNYTMAVVFSWLTSSRVLLTSRPVPVERFDEYNEMVRAVDLPAEIQAMFGESVSISNLRDLDSSDSAKTLTLLSNSNEADDSEGGDTAEQSRDDAATKATAADQDDANTDTSVTTYSLHTETELADRLYQLAGLLTVTFRQHGTEVQRLKSVLSAMSDPFPGATTLLKGEETQGDYDALNAANVLDSLTHRTMSDSIHALADAGFRAVRPELDKDSNYNFERLFRVAREAVSDNIMQNASQEELETIVAGEVMKAAARAETNDQYAEEEVKREPAEEFGEIFVNDILFGICNGDFYELRRHENSLAAGYNAAIRRIQQESFADQ